MGKYSERSKEYTAQYVAEHYQEIKFRAKPEEITREEIKEAAAAAGLSANQFMITAIRKAIDGT